jgi:hypothetical protein
MAKAIITPRLLAGNQMATHIRPAMTLNEMRMLIGPTISAIWPARTLPIAPMPEVTAKTADVSVDEIPIAVQ